MITLKGAIKGSICMTEGRNPAPACDSEIPEGHKRSIKAWERKPVSYRTIPMQ